MSLDTQVHKYLTTDIPEGRCSLSKSHVDLRVLAEHCQNDITRHEVPPLQTTQVYAAQSLASVAYQINTLAAQLVDLLKLQCDQWGEMEHQISDINQQFNFYEEKRSRHLIGKFTSEKPVHLMRRVNPPAQKEAFTKYERHPINFTVWDHIGHGSPTRDSVPATVSPPKKVHPGVQSYGQDRRSLLTPQATIDSDIYGTSFDAHRYLKKPVAHSIPIAHAIPRTDTTQEAERDFTTTSEMFVQGHTTDSLYDSLAHTSGGDRRVSETSEKHPLTASMSDTYQDPEAMVFAPSPLAEAVSPLSDTPPMLSPPPEELEPDLSLDDLDRDLYTQEETPAPPIDLPPSLPSPPSPPSPPPPEPIETPKPPRPANAAPARPPPSAEQQKRPSRSAPAAPESPSSLPPPPPTTSAPSRPPPTTSAPSRPPPPISGSPVRPSRPAPPPVSAVTELLAQDLPPAPFVDDPNVPAPPPDMPGPIEADPRIPKPPPNIPKDGVTRPAKTGSVSDAPASPAKKIPPKPAAKGFDPSDIINMQKSLKKKGALRTGATIDIPTQPDTPSSKVSIPEQSTQSVPISSPPPPSPSATGTPADYSASIPDTPPDIPDGWTKKPLGAAKSEPVAKKSATPKPQPPKSAAFDPSQIFLQRKLRTSQGSSSAPEPADTGSAPPKYIDKVETLFPYKAQKEDELNFGKGKIIYVLKKNPDAWYEGFMDGVRGLFPANYVKSIEQ